MNENTDKIISIKRIDPETFESIQFIPPNYSDNEIEQEEIQVIELTKPNKKTIKKKKESKHSIYDEFLIATENKQVDEVPNFNDIAELNGVNENSQTIKSFPRVNKYKKRCN